MVTLTSVGEGSHSSYVAEELRDQCFLVAILLYVDSKVTLWKRVAMVHKLYREKKHQVHAQSATTKLVREVQNPVHHLIS